MDNADPPTRAVSRAQALDSLFAGGWSDETTRVPSQLTAWAGSVAAALFAFITWMVVAPHIPWQPTTVSSHMVAAAPWDALALLVVYCCRRIVNEDRVIAFKAAGCAGALAVAAYAASLPAAAQASTKVLFAAAIGFLLATVSERLWWTLVIALIASSSDLWSVFSSNGVTNQLVESESQSAATAISILTIPVPNVGYDELSLLGSVDIVFAALFIGSAELWRTHPGWTATAICASLLVTHYAALHATIFPAIPAMAAAFLLVNARFLYDEIKARRAIRSYATDSHG